MLLTMVVFKRQWTWTIIVLLATLEFFLEEGVLTELPVCYSIVYHCTKVYLPQWYVQFLQVIHVNQGLWSWLVSLYSVAFRVYTSHCWCSGRVSNSTHTRCTASNLEQVANLLCAQANSASYPQQDRKWVVATATGWRPSMADWGSGVSASCTVGPVVR